MRGSQGPVVDGVEDIADLARLVFVIVPTGDERQIPVLLSANPSARLISWLFADWTLLQLDLGRQI